MSYKLVCFFMLFQFSLLYTDGQTFETKIYKIKGFGVLPIPEMLDTFGQNISKKYLIENILDNISKSAQKKIETDYQINVTKLFLENKDSSIIMFWPSYTLLYFLSSDEIMKVDDSAYALPEKFTMLPNILLQKKQFKYSSTQMKNAFSKIDNRNYLASNLADAYTGLIKTLVPTAIVSNISSSYFNYLNDYPTVKISFVYTIPDNEEKKSYKQDLYSIYKGNFNYLIRFEYSIDDKEKWKKFEEIFFKEIKLL